MSRVQWCSAVACKGDRSAGFLDGYLTEGVLDPECFYINQWVRRYFLLDGYLTGVLRTQGRVR